MSTEGLTTTGHVREALGRGLIDLKRKRIPIRFDGWYRLLSTMLLLPPSGAYVEVNDHIRVQMGWAFRARFPRSAIKSVAEATEKPLSRGVHGFAGRWLVNGSAHGLLTVDLTPSQRAYVMGFPVRLRVLKVSLVEPAALITALRASAEKTAAPYAPR